MLITDKALPHLQGSAFVTALRQINTVINIASFADGVTCLQTPYAAVEIIPALHKVPALPYLQFLFQLESAIL